MSLPPVGTQWLVTADTAFFSYYNERHVVLKNGTTFFVTGKTNDVAGDLSESDEQCVILTSDGLVTGVGGWLFRSFRRNDGGRFLKKL